MISNLYGEKIIRILVIKWEEAKRNVDANRIIILKLILHINMIQGREWILVTQIRDQWPTLEPTAILDDTFLTNLETNRFWRTAPNSVTVQELNVWVVRMTCIFITKEPWKYPTYRSDLTTTNYHLFPAINQSLGSHKLKDICSVERAVLRWMITQDKDTKIRGNEWEGFPLIGKILQFWKEQCGKPAELQCI